MTQLNKVLNILKSEGHITKMVAVKYNIGDIGRVCRALRAAGHDVNPIYKKDADGHRYTSYVYKASPPKYQAQNELFALAA